MSSSDPVRIGPSPHLNQAFESVYAEVRDRAEVLMFRERPGHTLDASALVNEVFLRLRNGGALLPSDRTHFVDLCVKAMRNVLIDHAKSRSRKKRPPPAKRVTLSEAVDLAGPRVVDAVVLSDALERLRERDEEAAVIADRRLFLGQSRSPRNFLCSSPASTRRAAAIAPAASPRLVMRVLGFTGSCSRITRCISSMPASRNAFFENGSAPTSSS